MKMPDMRWIIALLVLLSVTQRAAAAQTGKERSGGLVLRHSTTSTTFMRPFPDDRQQECPCAAYDVLSSLLLASFKGEHQLQQTCGELTSWFALGVTQVFRCSLVLVERAACGDTWSCAQHLATWGYQTHSPAPLHADATQS